jgi:hypothetical protein
MASRMANEYRIVLQPEAYEGMESAYKYTELDSPENDFFLKALR